MQCIGLMSFTRRLHVDNRPKNGLNFSIFNCWFQTIWVAAEKYKLHKNGFKLWGEGGYSKAGIQTVKMGQKVLQALLLNHLCKARLNKSQKFVRFWKKTESKFSFAGLTDFEQNISFLRKEIFAPPAAESKYFWQNYRFVGKR